MSDIVMASGIRYPFFFVTEGIDIFCSVYYYNYRLEHLFVIWRII